MPLTKKTAHQILLWLIAIVWIANGLFCKIFNFVPRHKQIVARILGDGHAPLITQLIGIAETIMAIWILSKIYSRFNALTQMAIIGTMNTIEYFMASDLLLWGKANAIFAMMFIILIGYNEFVLNTSKAQCA